MSSQAARIPLRTVTLAALGLLGLCPSTWAQPSSTRTVLAIYFSTEDYPANPVHDAGIREGLLAEPGVPIDYYTEYLESDRLPEQATLALRDYLREKYRGRRIDLVLAVTDTSLRFVRRYRDELFPDAPIVYFGNEEVDAGIQREAGGVTGVVVGNGFAETIGLALTLHPSTERMFVVAQVPNMALQDSVRSALKNAARETPLTFLDQATVPDLISAVEAVAPRSLILYVRHSQEDPGKILFSADVARLVANASPVPVYGVSDLYIGSGVVGGQVYQTREVGVRLGEMARQVLAGARPQDIAVARAAAVPIFDWRQLRRWGINESQLPAGSTILFREPGVWELYRAYILGGALIMIVQSALIAGLVVQRGRRRRTERALRESEQRSRETAERNQDLAGRLINAQEAERTRIARDLHDDLSQQLAGLGIMLSGLRRKVDKRGSNPEIDQTVTALLDRTSALAESVRNLSHELHPSVLQHAGLVQTLRSHCAGVEDNHHVAVKFSAGDHLDSLSPEMSLCLFRVVQEALTNAVRHARARTIRVQLMASEDIVELSISDDGIGFVSSERAGQGLGLRSIDERVRLARGQVTIESGTGQGTKLRVWLPLAIAQATLA